MKKTVIILILLLAAVFVILSILGRNDEYAAEKIFYRAMKTNKKITMNPDVAPPAMLATVESDIRKILEKYPDTKMAKAAHMTLAEFYITHKKYDEAISALSAIIGAEGQDVSTLSKAHFFKGSVYERQGQWPKALEEYKMLRDKYTDTPLGLQAPLYIGKHYTQEGRGAEANKAYNEAVRFYEKIERDNRGKVLGYAASTLLRESYISLEQFEQAGKVVEDTLNNYLSQMAIIQQLPYVELIFVEKLKNKEKAIEIYRYVMEKVEEGQAKDFLKKKIDELAAGNKQ